MHTTRTLCRRLVVAFLLAAIAVWQPIAHPHCPACAGSFETAQANSDAPTVGRCRCIACAARSTAAAGQNWAESTKCPCSDDCVCHRPTEWANVQQVNSDHAPASLVDVETPFALPFSDGPSIRSAVPEPYGFDAGDRCVLLCRFRI